MLTETKNHYYKVVVTDNRYQYYTSDELKELENICKNHWKQCGGIVDRYFICYDENTVAEFLLTFPYNQYQQTMTIMFKEMQYTKHDNHRRLVNIIKSIWLGRHK